MSYLIKFCLTRQTLLVACVLLLFVSCSNRDKPENLIKEETYIKLIVEFQVAESAFEITRDSSETKPTIHRILDRYNVGYRQFIKSHKYYSKNFQAQQERIQKAVDLLQQRMNPEKPYSTQNDSTDHVKKGPLQQ